MCLYPRLIKNPRFKVSKGKYDFGAITDARMKYVPIGCGNCIECRQQKSREWQTRLHEELKDNKYAYFITLTFSNESLKELMKKHETTESNAVAIIAVRLFLERWRKKYGKSLRHWLITELGHENTERIHLHGIVFPEQPLTNEELTKLWNYGRTDTGKYCNAQTINYIVKYVTKIDKDHKNYKPSIICSAGIGASYTKKPYNIRKHKFNDKKTNELYTLNNGREIALPIYYRNKFWNEKERNKLWANLLDKQKRYIRGIEIDISKGDDRYYSILREQQKDNKILGYGSTEQEWQKEDYNITFKMLQRAKKLQEQEKQYKIAHFAK